MLTTLYIIGDVVQNMLVMYVQNMPYEICSKIILRFMGEVLWQSVRLSIHPADGRTYMQIPPVFYRTSCPFGAKAQKGSDGHQTG